MLDLTNYDTKRNRIIKKRAVAVILILIIFPMMLACFQLSRDQPICPEPRFALVPQTLRKNGIDYDFNDLEFNEDIENITGITFNSKIIIKFNFTVRSNAMVKFFAKFVPENINILKLIGPNNTQPIDDYITNYYLKNNLDNINISTIFGLNTTEII